MARGDFQFSWPIRVRFAEVDVQGVVYNAHYLTYFDVAITEYMRGLGHLTTVATAKEGASEQVVRSVVEYKAPIMLDQAIEVCVRVARIGRTSLTFLLEIHPQGEDRLLATGEIVWVNSDRKAQKAVPFPADLTARIRAREGSTLGL